MNKKKWMLLILSVLVLGIVFLNKKDGESKTKQEVKQEEGQVELEKETEYLKETAVDEREEVDFINMDGLFFLTEAEQEGFQELVLDWLSENYVPMKKVKVYEQMEEEEDGLKFTFYLIVTRADEKHFVRGIYDLEEKSVEFALVEETELPGREKKELTEEEKAELEKEAEYLKETFVEEPEGGSFDETTEGN